MKLFPVPGMGHYDDIDYYGAFSTKKAAALGITQLDPANSSLEGVEHIQPLGADEKGSKIEYIVASGAY